MANLIHKVGRSLGVTTAALAALLSFSSASEAAPVDLAFYGLQASDAASYDVDTFFVMPPNAASPVGTGNAFLLDGTLITASGDASGVTLTMFMGGGSLIAQSTALGASDDGDFVDALFTVTSSNGVFAGLSPSIYAVLDWPGDFDAPFTGNLRIYQTSDLVDPNVVPLPAAGFLMLGALGGLGVFARRRR